MTVAERTIGDITILDVEGRMTAENVERPLVAAVRRLLQEGRTNLLVNLERVRGIDTTGLTELVEAYTTSQRQRAHLKFEYVPRHVYELLRVTHLLQVLETFEVEAEAIASFGAAVV